MNILVVSPFLSYPLFSGGHVRLYNLIRELSAKNEITLICERRENQTENDIAEVSKICKKVIAIQRPKQWSFANIAKAAISLNSFLVTGHTNKKMQEKIIEELENNKFDLIHVETYYVMQNLPKTSLPIVLVEHNIEYQVYSRFVNQKLAIFRPLLNLDIAKLKREEEKAWRRATKLVVVSQDDKKILKQKGLDSAIVANGVDIEKFSFKNINKSKTEKRILFIGDFKWIQNRDSAKWIIKEIWPLLQQGFDRLAKNNLKLWIVGRKIPDKIKNLIDDPDIIFDQESSIKPTQELFHQADVLLAPIRVGGGTSYKILEAMSCGTPVVTTSFSAEAIEAVDNKNIMVGKTASELAEKTVSLLQDAKLYETIARQGRELIEQKYTWEKIADDLESVYRSLL